MYLYSYKYMYVSNTLYGFTYQYKTMKWQCRQDLPAPRRKEPMPLKLRSDIDLAVGDTW